MSNELTKTSETMAKQVKEVLGLNNKQVLVDLLTLGYEDKPLKTKKLRKDFEEVVFFEKIQ
jgi:nitroreductase